MATDRTERLLNLVLCLLGSGRPVARAALRASIPGYDEAPSDEAFERMFERDKDELRSMGIPVETMVNVAGEVEGYLIDEDAYGMPELTLDAAELQVLGVAAHVWNDAAISAEAAAAVRKIEATTGELAAVPPLLAVHPGAGEESLPTLWEAIRSRRLVVFSYLARGRETAERRTVEPWSTVRSEGAWYLVGHSRERAAGRAFRLSRVQGQIQMLKESFAPVDHADVSELIRALSDPPTTGTAVLTLPEVGAAALRTRARPAAGGRWEVDFADADVLVGRVLEAGGDIVSPPHLAERLRQSLAAVRDAHRQAPGGGHA